MSEEKIGIKTDCKFYRDNRHCMELKEMYCHKEVCSFYDNGEEQQILRMPAEEFEKAKAEAVKRFAEKLCIDVAEMPECNNEWFNTWVGNLLKERGIL